MRGRMLELMGIGYLEGADLANLFLVGAFSMLPSMLMQPMACAIASLALPEGVADALLSRHGRYGAVLESAEVLESGGDADLLSSGLSVPKQTAASGPQSTDPNAACKGPDDSTFPRFMV
jgi:c-di-GMP-related signal transduction protein